MDSYDAIIYGNDIHSLITALLILKKEKRVLLVNQNDRVGNFTEYYQRRRFTFNNIYNTLSFASEDNNDMINRLIKELNTKYSLNDSIKRLCAYIAFNEPQYITRTNDLRNRVISMDLRSKVLMQLNGRKDIKKERLLINCVGSLL